MQALDGVFLACRRSELHVGELFTGARLFEHRLGASDVRLIGTLVDDEQRVTCAHDRAFHEGDALHETRNARAHLDGIDRLEVSGELLPVGNLALDHRRDGDLWRRGRCRPLTTCGEGETREQQRGGPKRGATHDAGLQGQTVSSSELRLSGY